MAWLIDLARIKKTGACAGFLCLMIFDFHGLGRTDKEKVIKPISVSKRESWYACRQNYFNSLLAVLP
ncbi:hypothetical protein [Microbulbifer epialgicus]|uniref:Uncharacterized protein n=1 Tax=Microbulbifer epialgicus TaxID=393907 RepID=A0ABV4NZR4_9GAMM